MGTEIIIDKVMKFLDLNPTDDLGNWPADAIQYGGMTLSHSKMLNSLDLLEPRQAKQAGKFEVYPLFSTNTGWHSTVRPWRKSEIEELGEGTNLYFKFLKYFMLLFLFCAGLSGPASAFYAFGFEYLKVPDILN